MWRLHKASLGVCRSLGWTSQRSLFMYGCESWLSAEELMLLDCGAGEDS